jgi:hypothetical protein
MQDTARAKKHGAASEVVALISMRLKRRRKGDEAFASTDKPACFAFERGNGRA